MAVQLSISCVTFSPDELLLQRVFRHLLDSLEQLSGLSLASIFLIDNGPDLASTDILRRAIRSIKGRANLPLEVSLIVGHGNIGFGAGHNLVLPRLQSDYHLVLNPDVIVNTDALDVGVDFLQCHPDVALVAPHARYENGDVQYIAKRFPSLGVLMLRGLAPDFVCERHKQKIHRYELRDRIPASSPLEIDIASGCFMLIKTSAFEDARGFDPRFFMYFEDFDLSMRLRAQHKIVHLPEMKVIHLGGNAAKKGRLHIWYFLNSARRFFGKHGWRFY